MHSAGTGNLVSNAPHLPVHLGAMSEAVKYQIRHYGAGGAGAAEGMQVGVRCGEAQQGRAGWLKQMLGGLPPPSRAPS